jgi:hypothetical protein
MISEELTLDSWLEQTQALREKLYEYAKSPLPLDMGERHNDMDQAIQNAACVGRLVADLDFFVTQMTCQAVMSVKSTYEKFSAEERKLIVKDKIKDIQLLADRTAVDARAIRDRIYTNQNENRAGR